MTGKEMNQGRDRLRGKEVSAMEKEKRFMSIRETARYTGISEAFIRKGVRDHTIPHFMSGNKALINVPLFIEIIDEQSRRAISNG